MELMCNSCSKKILVPDEKIPLGKSFHVACPNCKTKISAAPKNDNKPLENVSIEHNPSSPMAESLKSEEDELDFVEEGVKVALVCDNENTAVIVSKLEETGYQVKVAKNSEDAINRIRFTLYDIIALNEKFCCSDMAENTILNYLQPMPMTTRRKIVLLLISDQYRTFDSMEAFVHSVNFIVNRKDLSNLTKIMKKFIQDHERFYKIFNESLIKSGKD